MESKGLESESRRPQTSAPRSPPNVNINKRTHSLPPQPSSQHALIVKNGTITLPRPINYSPSLANSLQSKDSSYTYIHFNRPRDADLFEDFCKDKLPDDEIYVPPHNQAINPEDGDDVVPDQHAAFGIQRATQKVKEAAWKDLGLADLMKKGPDKEKAGIKAGSRSLPR